MMNSDDNKIQILLGTLLGDACVDKIKKESWNCAIKWEHSTKQEEYALWKAENSLNNFSIYRRSRLDKRTNNTYHSVCCYSTKDDYKYFRKLFYNPFKKVSKEILNSLKPLGIAVWFMDDGNLFYNGNSCHLTLSVNAFDEDSVNKIISYFCENYSIYFKKSGKAIRLTSVKQIELFESFFKKFYHQSMLYKTLEYQKEKYDKTLTDEQRKYRQNKYK